MASKYFFAFFVFIITWTCLIETTLGAASWCFQCDSRNPGCQIDLSPAVIAESRIPCNGQCYVRMKEGIMSRGCSWEHGFMTPQLSLTQIYQNQAIWVFCDTPFCNGNANILG